MAVAQTQSNAPDEWIATHSLPEGSAWAADARSDALGRLRAMGLPGRRDEYWKFTRPESLISASPTPAAVFHAGDEPEMYGDIDRLKIVFVDGVFDQEASDDLAMEGLEIDRLTTATAMDIHWAKDLYGVLEHRGQTPVARSLAALNTAFATDGIVIRATAKV